MAISFIKIKFKAVQNNQKLTTVTTALFLGAPQHIKYQQIKSFAPFIFSA